MKILARTAAVAFLVGSVGYYLWHGLTYRGSTDYGPDVLAWVGPQMALPIIACVAAALVFVFTVADLAALLSKDNTARFRGSPIGIGTVRSFHQTGLSINDQPQLRIDFSVEGVDGAVFDGYTKMIVPLTELPLLRPGVVLPVRYLPGSTEVQIDKSGDASQAQRAMNDAMIRRGVTTAHKLDIAARGIAAQAVVRSLSVPGEIRGGSSKVVLELVVTRSDGSNFVTRSETFLPPAAVGQAQVGRIVEVRYLAEDENDVVLALPANPSA
ncbi:hypothetical protein [Nocardia callitridis]|uniref:DUF2993 domain-containing protein n=1 Tax=Nocardia callitridis TaxID=648753 RepID=A0ABP9JYK8_9NOCA